jgi:hypothetical protein
VLRATADAAHQRCASCRAVHRGARPGTRRSRRRPPASQQISLRGRAPALRAAPAAIAEGLRSCIVEQAVQPGARNPTLSHLPAERFENLCEGPRAAQPLDNEPARVLGRPNALLRRRFAEPRLTLVTYDLATIPPVLVSLAASGESHAGVVLIDEQTIPTSDFGGLVRAIVALCSRAADWEWTDRVVFLAPT